MSLKDLAQQMKATGRKGDTELVHMTKREVAGLQALAEAAGGTLTKNPKTGLPEASFLEQLLPTIIGIGLAPFTGGMSAAAIGAGTGALLNEDDPLMGAITGGLGAFGGASLGAGLSAAGATGAAAPTTGAIGGGLTPGATQGLTQGAKLGINAITPTAGAGGINYGLATGAAPSTYGLASGAAPMTTAALPAVTAPTTFANMGQGIQSLFTNPADAVKAMGGGMNVAKNVGMGLAPALLGGAGSQRTSERPGREEDTEDLMGRYEYRANPTGGTRRPGAPITSEAMYFDPEFRPKFLAAKGGEVKKFADGGEAAAPSSDVMADPAAGMTGMSRDAMLYLYGMAPSSTSANIPVGQTDYVAPEIRFARRSAAASGGGGGGGIGYYAPSFGGGFGGEGSIGVNPNQDFGYWSGVSPNIDYSIPVVDRMDFGGSGGMFGGYSPDAPGQEGFDGSPAPGTGPDSIGGLFSEGGGIAALARGGMKAGGFVVPADVVSMVGEGNTDAGYDRIKRMIPGATPIKGKDGGQADTVATSIEGKQPARIAHGEMYVPPAAVKRAGGAKKLYAMMKNVRKQAKGDTKQIKPVNLKKALA